MIPDLALIISAYIIFRMFETFALSHSRYASKTGLVLIYVLAVIVILIVGWNLLDIWLTGSHVGTGLQPSISPQ